MKIRKLRLQNFRGFEDKTFEFSDQFNVIVGDNGTGKTSLLRALSIVASLFLKRLNGGGIVIEPYDVRQVGYQKGTSFTLEPQYPVVVSVEGILADEEFSWAIAEGEEGEGRGRRGWETVAARLREQVQGGKDVLLPLVTYFGTGRLWLPKKNKDWYTAGSRIEGYSGWSEPTSNVGLLMGWLKAQEAITLQRGRASGMLNSVKQAIANCMENWGEVSYDFSEDDLIAQSVDRSRALPFRMLSDGEQNMLAMVADIARRTAILNPHLEERALSETSGIVLIDELDLHLHPRWQRRIVNNLRETFPKLQFIVTTHSPFIIQALHSGELVDLNEREPAEYENESIEDITENVMGVEVPQRSHRYQEMMEAAEEYYRVLQKAERASPEEVELLKKRLDELSAPFSDNVAYHAFLEMEREAAGLGENES